jgi:two-component system response regulator NreC
MRLRVALVDDHLLFREGLRALLSSQADIQVVGEAADARQAYNIVEAEHPDVVVLDLSLPGVDGIAATRELRRRAPGGKVLMLSMHTGEEFAAQALAAGASGYALKSQPSVNVVEAIRTVARGETYLSPEFSRTLLDEQLRGRMADGGPIAPLSEREREVFDLLVRGFSNQAAATELCISVKTVETHRSHIHRKLGVHSVAELMRFAALHGLIKQ